MEQHQLSTSQFDRTEHVRRRSPKPSPKTTRRRTKTAKTRTRVSIIRPARNARRSKAAPLRKGSHSRRTRHQKRSINVNRKSWKPKQKKRRGSGLVKQARRKQVKRQKKQVKVQNRIYSLNKEEFNFGNNWKPTLFGNPLITPHCYIYFRQVVNKIQSALAKASLVEVKAGGMWKPQIPFRVGGVLHSQPKMS